MGEDEGNGDFVTRAECRETSGTILLALHGEDLRGGLVKDISTILEKTSWLEDEVKKNGTIKADENKLNVTRYAITMTFIGVLVGAGVSLIIAFFK